MSAAHLHTEQTLLGYFHDAICSAARNQQVAASESTVHYLSRLLTDYARSERLFDDSAEGRRLQPLAVIYGQALQARSPREQHLQLQRLGDLALFVGGLFGGRLQRRFTDLDYCVKMGTGAYGQLSDLPERVSLPGALQAVFRELAHGFGRFVGVLSEIGAQRAGAQADPFQLFDLWQQSRSPQLAERLAALGLTPLPVAPSRHH